MDGRSLLDARRLRWVVALAVVVLAVAAVGVGPFDVQTRSDVVETAVVVVCGGYLGVTFGDLLLDRLVGR